MALPPFATLEDLDLRRPGGLKDRERPRAWAALIDASALVRSVANGKTWTNSAGELVGAPEILVAVVCASARRVLDNPDGLLSETEQLGSYQHGATYANASGDVYLTQAEQRQIRKAAGIRNVTTVATTRDPDGIGLETASITTGGGDLTLPVEPDGEPIPWGGEV